MYVKLGETIRGLFGTSSFSTGASVDADALPTCAVLDQGTLLGYTPTVVNKATGLYEVPIDVTVGNGFAVNRSYTTFVVVVVAGVTARSPINGVSSFNTVARNPDDFAFPTVSGRSMSVDISGNVSANVANTPTVVNAILDELLTGHAIVGSVADGIAIAAGMLQGNFLMDQTNNADPNGQTAARLRVFRTGVATAAATDGGSGQGEFATFVVTTTYTGLNKIATHRVVRQ